MRCSRFRQTFKTRRSNSGLSHLPIRADGSNDGENLTLAAQNALLAMVDLITERGYTAEQAYVICSVAVDLRISNIVHLPNVTVSALLPEGIFES